MTKFNIKPSFRGLGGAMYHPVGVINDGWHLLGYVVEVFSDVFYVKHAGNPYRDTTRYRSFDAACAALAR